MNLVYSLWKIGKNLFKMINGFSDRLRRWAQGSVVNVPFFLYVSDLTLKLGLLEVYQFPHQVILDLF